MKHTPRMNIINNENMNIINNENMNIINNENMNNDNNIIQNIMNNENMNNDNNIIQNIMNNENMNNGYHLLPLFEDIDQQENFIGIEQQLFNSVTLQPNMPLPDYQQQFLENHDYNMVWEWSLRIDLERYIDPFSVVDLDYLHENINTIENNDQILHIIENNPTLDDLVNGLKTLPLKDRMNVYMIGNCRH
jgi:hypothetical protein